MKTPAILLLFAAMILVAPSLARAQGGVLETPSARLGATPNGNTLTATITSGDGRFMAFASDASNLVPADRNQLTDLFLFDRESGAVDRLSVPSTGGDADGISQGPSLSADGRFVVFESSADNLVSLDGNGFSDIFLIDREEGTLDLVSRAPVGGRANGDSFGPIITDDGRFVIFASEASNLVANDTNGVTDIFLFDVENGEISRINLGVDGVQANGDSFLPDISADGTMAVFASDADNLISPAEPVNLVSPADSNGTTDIFAVNLETGDITRVSVDPDGIGAAGTSTSPRINGDGTIVVFTSDADNLVANDRNGVADIFVRDLSTGVMERISVPSRFPEANGDSLRASIDNTGRFVAFDSVATNLVQNDRNRTSDIFLRDRNRRITTRVSLTPGGLESNGASLSPEINGTGRAISFLSAADNLAGASLRGNFQPFLFRSSCAVNGAGEVPDTDGDGVDDCEDACPADPAKTEAGAAGCGGAGNDSDADGLADDSDKCPSDPQKTEAGMCGCGVPEDDQNGNSLPDCLDPARSSVPDRGVIRRRRNGGMVFRIPRQYLGTRYRVVVKSNGRVIERRTTRRRSLRLSLPPGNYTIRYRVSLVDEEGFTRASRPHRFVVD